MKSYKWKKALTAEEAALFVLGLHIYKTLDEEREFIQSQLSNTDSSEDALASSGYLDKLIEAQFIRDAIIEDSLHEVSAAPSRDESILTLTDVDYSDWKLVHDMSPEMSAFTKKSLAHWFYQAGDAEKAKMLDPIYIPNLQNSSALVAELQEQNKKLTNENKLLTASLEKKNKNTVSFKESSKPYKLIAQLIGIILPDSNLQETYKVHSQISRILKADDVVVSEPTLKSY